MELGDTDLTENLKLVALLLAILEKAGHGRLGFRWAKMALLGGFATALEPADFYIVPAILLIGGARIFSRSHELEWQHQATSSVSFRAIARVFSFLLSPSCRSPSVLGPPDSVLLTLPGYSTSTVQTSSTNPIGGSPESPNVHPCSIRLFKSSSKSRLLYWLQVFSAIACAILSLTRLIQANYGDIAGPDKSTKRNLRPALIIFYGLYLAEAVIFLAKRAYLEWMLSCCLLLGQVSSKSDLEHIRVLFFYEAYSRCINGKIFDVMKMNMVSFAEELLVFGSGDKQLIGARALLKFADKTMERIGMSELPTKRLVKMLNWTSSSDKEIRTAAAVVVSRLAGKNLNGSSLMRITGAMDCIATLLDNENYESTEEIMQRQTMADPPETNYYHKLYLYGLITLEKLANDPCNCIKISETKNLISKIISFTTAIIPKLGLQNSIADTDPDFQATKLALQVLKLLAGTTGTTGKSVRREILKDGVTIGKIRNILEHSGEHSGKVEILMPLQELVDEIITYLSTEGKEE